MFVCILIQNYGSFRSDQCSQNVININIFDSAIDWIADQGFDRQYGARPLKRIMQKSILNALSKQIIEGNIDKNKTITIDYFDGNELIFRL